MRLQDHTLCNGATLVRQLQIRLQCETQTPNSILGVDGRTDGWVDWRTHESKMLIFLEKKHWCMRCNCVFRLQEVRASVTKCGHTAIAPWSWEKPSKPFNASAGWELFSDCDVITDSIHSPLVLFWRSLHYWNCFELSWQKQHLSNLGQIIMIAFLPLIDEQCQKKGWSTAG